MEVAGLVKASVAPVPTAPDGLRSSEVMAPSDPKPQLSYLQTVLEQAKNGTVVEGVYRYHFPPHWPSLSIPPRGFEVGSLAASADLDEEISGLEVALHAAQQLTKPLDDRKLLLEEVVTLLGRLPPESSLGTDLSNTLIRFLWLDLVRFTSELSRLL